MPRFAWLDFEMPPLAWATLWIILPYSLILAGVGLIESLMTMTLIDELTETRGRGNRECVGQGVANVTCGVFGGMGGCAMIGQSLINVKSGGRGRLSGITAAVGLLVFILFLSPYIEAVPMAALVGVMFMVVIGTFAWKSLTILRKVPLTDALVIVLVTVVTVLTDLAIAVVVGVIVSALQYAWSNAVRIRASTYETPEGAKVYQVKGPLFFGSTDGFTELFKPETDPELVVIDFAESRVADQSALTTIEAVAASSSPASRRASPAAATRSREEGAGRPLRRRGWRRAWRTWRSGWWSCVSSSRPPT